MKKLILLFLMSIFLIQCVYASNLNVDSIKMYTLGDSGERIKFSGVDSDGGTIKIRPGAQLIVEAKIENTNLTMNMKKLKFKAYIQDIDDGANLKEVSDSFKLNADDMGTYEFSFYIPAAAQKDYYDFNLSVDVQWDDLTLEQWSQFYEVQVTLSAIGATDVITPGSNYVPMQDIVLNMSKNCNRYFDNLQSFYSQNLQLISSAKNITYDAVICESRRLEIERVNTQLTYFQDQYNIEKTSADTKGGNATQCNQDLMLCNYAKNDMQANMKTRDQVKAEVDQAIMANKPTILHWGGWILLVCAVAYWQLVIEKKRKKYSTSDDNIIDQL